MGIWWEFDGQSGNLVGKSDFWRRKGEKQPYPSNPNADYRSTLEWDLLVEIFGRLPRIELRFETKGACEKISTKRMENRGFIDCAQKISFSDIVVNDHIPGRIFLVIFFQNNQISLTGRDFAITFVGVNNANPVRISL